jgi:hypothetical protein
MATASKRADRSLGPSQTTTTTTTNKQTITTITTNAETENKEKRKREGDFLVLPKYYGGVFSLTVSPNRNGRPPPFLSCVTRHEFHQSLLAAPLGFSGRHS